MDDDGSSGDEAGQSPPILEGTVTRQTSIAEGEDGVGTLYVAALAECDLSALVLGVEVVPSADFFDEGAAVDVSFVDLPQTEVAIALFLDDNLDADPDNPLPGPGDMVYADVVQDGVLSCVMALNDEIGVELPLTGTVPSLPPS